MEKKKLVHWLSIGAILLAGCNSGVDSSSVSESIENVKIQKVEPAPVENKQVYIGTIEESTSVPLSFLISGSVEKVLVDEGQRVIKGQLLATINSYSYESAYQIALSKEKQAQDAYNRLEPVYKDGSLPEVKFVEVKTGLVQAKSTAQIAEKNLHDCELYAPMSGIIGKRMVESGMSIIPVNPVFQLVRIENVKVRIPVPENEIAAITNGEKVVVIVPALNDQQYEGTVSEIGVLSNTLSHTYTVKAILNNPKQALKPGMVCKVSIISSTLAMQMVIPMSAVQVSGSGEKRYVFVANTRTGKAMKRTVQVGPLTVNGVIIKSGLSAGDLLIIDGYQKIDENSAIKIIE